jgi:hypothetical protein
VPHAMLRNRLERRMREPGLSEGDRMLVEFGGIAA